MTHEQILAIMELTEQEKVAKIIELEMRLKTEVSEAYRRGREDGEYHAKEMDEINHGYMYGMGG